MVSQSNFSLPMEARITKDTLKSDFEALAHRHALLQAKAKTKPSSEWQSEARVMLRGATEMLRRINTRVPLGSEERLFLTDAKSRVLGYLSFWDRLLNKK
ncbi:MAG: hypothetical protein AB1668_01845 [Nanoarchaeota archaeon]